MTRRQQTDEVTIRPEKNEQTTRPRTTTDPTSTIPDSQSQSPNPKVVEDFDNALKRAWEKGVHERLHEHLNTRPYKAASCFDQDFIDSEDDVEDDVEDMYLVWTDAIKAATRVTLSKRRRKKMLARDISDNTRRLFQKNQCLKQNAQRQSLARYKRRSVQYINSQRLHRLDRKECL